MALPTSAAAVRAAQDAFKLFHFDRNSYRDAVQELYRFREMLWQGRRVYLQRPHSDDMMQMCVDLGVDVPNFQPISFDGQSFRFQPTAAVMVDAEGCRPISLSEMYVIEDRDGHRSQR